MRAQKNTKKSGVLLIAGWVILSTTIPSQAQIEEILVTAQKRETGIQTTPVAITAFDAQALQHAGIDDALDIQLFVPNTVFSKTNFSSANFSIRGVGNSAVGVSADSGTGVHVNGVYLNAPRIFETEYYDVERIEVLRGPQGTLYGRNTTAGVINVITAKPDDVLAGQFSLEMGNYNAVKTKGVLNLPIGDSVAQRFSAFSLDRDGYVDNLYTGNDIDGRDMWSVRSSTRVNFSETVDSTLMVMHFKEDDSRSRVTKQLCRKDPEGILGCLPTGLGFDTPHGAASASGALAELIGLHSPGVDQYADSINPPDMRKVYLDYDPRYFVEETIASLEFNWRLAGYTVTSLTGYSKAYVESRMDYDWTVPSVDFNYPVVGFLLDGEQRVTAERDRETDYSNEDSEQVSQELRITSDMQGPFNFTAGFFAMSAQIDSHYTVHFPSGYQYGQLVGIPEEQSLYDNHMKNYRVKTWALFGESYYELRNSTRVTFGLRYTDEHKEAESRQLFLDFKSSISDPYLFQENNWQEWTGKVGVDRQLELGFTNDTLLFASIARGYKGGGFNPPGSMTFSSTFDPEYLNAFEAGAKNTLMNRRLQANFTFFHYDYEGLQMSKIVEQTSINENVDAMITGLESEFTYVPDEHWRVQLNLAYLDAEIGDFVSFDTTDPAQTGSAAGVFSLYGSNYLLADPSSSGVDIDLQGNRLPNAPEFSATASVEYVVAIGGDYDLTARLQCYWQDEFFARVFNTQKDKVGAWSVWDAQLRLESPTRPWSVKAWVKNIKNEDHVTGHYTTDATSGLFTNVFTLEPRTYGLTFGYRFN
jgi:iron complex outermembrane recepter protein